MSSPWKDALLAYLDCPEDSPDVMYIDDLLVIVEDKFPKVIHDFNHFFLDLHPTNRPNRTFF